MATGIKAAGTDLDSIFEPRTTTKIANVNIKSNGGVDISNRFEDIASGSGPSATGIKSGGTDLNALFAALGSVDVITVSGEVISAINFNPLPAQADLKFDNDGKVYKRLNLGSFTQIDSGADWLRPTASAPADYEVRFVSLTGDALDASSAAVNVWRALSVGDFIWTQESTTGQGTQSSTFTVQIRKGSGSVIDSASYTLTAEAVV